MANGVTKLGSDAGCSRYRQAWGSRQPERGGIMNNFESHTGQLWIGTHGAVSMFSTR